MENLTDLEIAIKMAEDIKKIRNDLITFSTTKDYQKITTKEIRRSLTIALKHIDNYRSKAENKLFDNGTINDLDIFY